MRIDGQSGGYDSEPKNRKKIPFSEGMVQERGWVLA
jgi:hypothetical protein